MEVVEKVTEPELEIPLIKRGELVIQVNLKRNPAGLFVNVKVHPGIEEFARGLGTTELQDVRTIGRYWTPTRPTSPERGFSVWNMTTNPGNVTGPNGVIFRLDRPGQGLTDNSGIPIPNNKQGLEYPVINLSFLRLQGISEGAGVNFHVKGVFTFEAVKQLADQIEQATRAFYIIYLKPIDMDVMVMTQEKS